MRTLREKIIVPVIFLLLVSYLVVLVAVNFTVSLFVQSNIEDTLIRSAQTSMQILKDSGEKFGDYVKVMSQMKQSGSLIDINYFLIDNNGLVYTVGESNYQLFEKMDEKLEGNKEGEIVELAYNNVRYLCLNVPIENYENSNVRSFVVYGDLTKSNDFVNDIRKNIFMIMTFSGFLAILVFNKISNDFIEILKRITMWSKQIAKGEYAIVENTSDILELKELTRSLSYMSMELKKNDQAQKTFFQNVSHEFRTPLMSIQGYAEGIKLKVFDDPVTASEVIIEESKRLNKLVNELLYVSRLEIADKKYSLEPIYLDDFLKIEYVKIQGAAMMAKKELLLDNVCHELVELDIDKMARVINNLVSNSLRFAKSKVIIKSFSDKNFAYIDISDDGNGFDKDDLPYVFVRFYKGKQGKFGLGLAIAKMIVEGHEGEISAFNDDIGAVVRVKLPIRAKSNYLFDKLPRLN